MYLERYICIEQKKEKKNIIMNVFLSLFVMDDFSKWGMRIVYTIIAVVGI